ncbi:hypothetical protein C6P46_003531 [Rhodotorula mucilaginosa]|uniref:RNA-binding protein n=1 Tax=Rhodotorula mucilaginosa TaxID=5537 RepID=A0A9P6W469_RHOMI|nr:hypothetical protein C6P46_003531 [Rhodotorula mucilaginosa]
MSGYDDPYRHPREQQQHRRGGEPHYGAPQRHREDELGRREEPRGYRDDHSYGYGARRGDEQRGYPPHRGSSAWHDDEREYKRGRYQDEPRYQDRDHRPYSPYQPQPPPHHDPYGRPDYNAAAYPPPPDANAFHPRGDGRDRRGDSSGPTPRSSKAPELEPPSASVILLGLPERVNDVSLRNFLEDMGASIDSTTVIMDRQTGLSKRFGFAKFSSVEHARSFVEPNFPSIPWRERAGPGPDDGMRIKINYSQKTGGWRDDQGASARLSEDQRSTTGAVSQGFYMNDGTRDIGTTPGSILLLRGLDPLTTEAEIATALSRIGGRASQEIVARGGLKKVMLVKDRASRSSWGFAFVQLADTRLATDVLASAFNPQFHPTGFRIRNAVVAASFSHENSFIPLYSPSPWSFRGDGGAQLAYWDDKGFAQPWIPPPTPDPAAALPGVPKAPRAQEEAKAEADLEAFFDSIEADLPLEGGAGPASGSSEPIGPQAAQTATPALPPVAAASTAAPPSALPAKGGTAPPISIKPITSLPSAPPPPSTSTSVSVPPAALKSDPMTKSTAPSPAAAASGETPAPPPATAVLLDAKEKKGDLIVSRKAAPNLAKWNKKAKELRSANPAPAPPPTAAAAAATAATVKPAPTASSTLTSQTPQSQQQQKQKQASPPSAAAGTSSSAGASPAAVTPVPVAAFDDPEFVHGDPISFQCLLCQRQFKAIEELRKHNKLSQLHKAHFLFETRKHDASHLPCATRKAAAAKKYAAAAVGGGAAQADSSSTKPKYVDRAAARRVALGKSEELQPGQNQKKRKFEAPEPPKPTPAAPNKDGLEESNAGRKMLEKMGWSAGGGLGAEGAGRVDPIQAAQFQQRAGLGATKGVAVGSEEAPVTYADRMREKALKRFNS